MPEVRVVAEDGSNLGVLPTNEALRRAQEAGLDLVEVNPKANPPVCKILDFGKYKYEEKKKQRDAKRKQTVVEVKEIKIRPKTDDHDLDVKVRAIRKFIEPGNKVKVTCRFRGREIMHPQRARDAARVDREQGRRHGQRRAAPDDGARTMAVLLAPKPQVLQRLANERAAKEREKPEGQLHSDSDDHDHDHDHDEGHDHGDEGDEDEATG